MGVCSFVCMFVCVSWWSRPAVYTARACFEVIVIGFSSNYNYKHRPEGSLLASKGAVKVLLLIMSTAYNTLIKDDNDNNYVRCLPVNNKISIENVIVMITKFLSNYYILMTTFFK